jgi:competence transcription factor ComK
MKALSTIDIGCVSQLLHVHFHVVVNKRCLFLDVETLLIKKGETNNVCGISNKAKIYIHGVHL